jgi:hypothetical protein
MQSERDARHALDEQVFSCAGSDDAAMIMITAAPVIHGAV